MLERVWCAYKSAVWHAALRYSISSHDSHSTFVSPRVQLVHVRGSWMGSWVGSWVGSWIGSMLAILLFEWRSSVWWSIENSKAR
jgi:hypothetical protein